jgi:hypothetical protein
MSNLSQFRAGNMIEVRSKEEILATLDAQGCLEGMPFMPEMLQFSGKRFRVGAVAHKTCETAQQTWKGRGLKTAVHLAGVRCDGAAHGGCQADCNLFWKDAWIKPVDDEEASSSARAISSSSVGYTETQLFEQTKRQSEGEEVRYSCQATMLYDATEPLEWWDIRQYIRDVRTRNHSPAHVLRVLWIAFLKVFYQHTPTAYRLSKAFRDWMHQWLTGREIPDFTGALKRGSPTPTGRLNLKPGDRVRIRSKEEIVQTVDEAGVNRGLSFDVEMAPYCGSIATVRSSVTMIIDELTGRMRHMKQPCIMLENVVCNSEYSACRLLCPRQIPSYWREIWLEKIDSGVATSSEPSEELVVAGSHRE